MADSPRNNMEVPAKHVLRTTYSRFAYLLTSVEMDSWIHSDTTAGTTGPVFHYWRDMGLGNGTIEQMIVATGLESGYSVTFK